MSGNMIEDAGKPLPAENGEFLFCQAPAELLRMHRVEGRTGKVFESLGALSSCNNLVVLRNLCRALAPKRTLEIGPSFGGSCLVFTASHRDFGHQADRQHMALDPFQAIVWDDCGLLLAEKAGPSGYLDFRSVFSALELPALIRDKQKFDLVYIDGSHLFEDVFVDRFFVGQLLADGGVMVLDDSSDPNIAKVLRFRRRNFAGSYRELDLAPFRADRGETLKYRLARLLNRNQLSAFRRVGPSVREWDSRLVRF